MLEIYPSVLTSQAWLENAQNGCFGHNPEGFEETRLRTSEKQTVLAIVNEESADRHDGDKGIVTVEEFLHRLRIPDLGATCLRYSKE